MEELDRDQRAVLLERLDVETAADALQETPPEITAQLLEEVSLEKAADILEEMAPDEAADVLGELPHEARQELLDAMDRPEAREVQAFVRGRTKAIRECYDRALKRDATLRGRVVVRFTIGTCGEISDLELAGRRTAPDLAGCVTRAVKSWRTPFRPSEPVAIEYPFNFTAL